MELKEILNTMHQEDIDSLIVLKPENIAYLTGFKPTTSSVLILKDESVLFTPKMEIDDASAQSGIQIEELKSMDGIKKCLKGTLGIEDSMTVSTYKKLCNDFETEVTDIIESSRILKSDDEVKSIKKAIEIAESSLLNTDISGTENKVAAELEYNMRIKESMKPAFETIVASGIRSSLPHATVSSHNLEKPVVVDWGAVWNNYCSDTTRTIIESEKHTEIFEIVLEAQKKAIKVIKPGIKASYVDKVARDIIGEYGYADSFIHSTGHGLGLEVHEKPSISKNDQSKLQKGMVITVEPGIYIKGEFGVRIEDVIHVKNRSTVLNKMKKKLDF